MILRSPTTAATICFVLRHTAVQSQRLSLRRYTKDHTSSSSKTSFACAGSSVSAMVGERATFFYPWSQRVSWYARCSLYASHTAPLLIQTKNLFLTFRRVRLRFWLQNTTSPTIPTQVLLIAIAIASILHDILAAALRTAMNLGFGNHGGSLLSGELIFLPKVTTKSCIFIPLPND